MLVTTFKIIFLAVAVWFIYALLTGHPSKDIVTRTIRNSGNLSRSKTTQVIWWSLIGTGALWLLLTLLHY